MGRTLARLGAKRGKTWLIKPIEKPVRSGHLGSMSVFESTAVLDDPMHLTLGRPVPEGLSRHCRVMVMFDVESGQETWPQGFFNEILIDDAAFERPAQGAAPFIAPLDA